MSKRPDVVFMISFTYPVISLPFYVLFNHEIGNLNILMQTVSILSLVLLISRNRPKIEFGFFVPIYFSIFLLIGYGILKGISVTPVTIIFLGVKLLFLPFFLAMISRFPDELRTNLIRSLFIVQIANSIAAVLETILGVNSLMSLGLEYGTNLRNFDSFLRAPGLALTNYELGSFSAAILLLVYLISTQQFALNRKLSNRFCLFTGLASMTCLILSNFRSGMVFTSLAILLCEIISRRNLLGASVVLTLGSGVVLVALLSNFFLLNSNSSIERQSKWADLLSTYDWKFGSGIGFSGAATRSSFATSSNLIVTDNQFVTVLLQFGLFGLFSALFILIYFFMQGNFISKSIVIALAAMMFFVEVWDLTLFFSLVLFFMFDGIRVRRNLLPS
jgi:hypothetical protein